jgi:hypothetical protein
MIPFEALSGKNCNPPISWDNLADRAIVGLDFLSEMEEKMVNIRKNLKVA